MAAAERAPEGYKKPPESRFDGIPGGYGSEINRSAMRASCEQHVLKYLDQVAIDGSP